MNSMLRALIFASSTAALVACGSGDSTTSTNPEMTITLVGAVYDEELANAEVEVFVGTNPTPVGTGFADANGNYTLTLTVSEDVTNQACVVRATRGNFSLDTLPGTVNTVAAAAQGGIASANALPGLNITNVSTALLAVIRDDNGGDVPNSQDLIDAAEAVIEANLATQAQVLELAAAIRVIIDSGVALPAGSTDTTDLVVDILDGSNTSFVTDNQIAITDAETAIESDPILAAQLIVPPILTTDLEGQQYVVGEDTMIAFEAGGQFSLYDLESLAASTTSATGTWSLDYPSQVVTVNLTDTADSTTSVAQLNFNGGNPNVIPLSSLIIGGISQGPQTMIRVLSPTIPFRGFNTAESTMLSLADCTGVTGTDNRTGSLAGSMEVDCSMDVTTGAMLITPTALLTNDGVGGVNRFTGPFPFTMPVAIFALAGSSADTQQYVSWEQEFDFATGALVPDSIITSYGKSRVVSVDKPIIPGSSSLRIDAVTGDTTIAMVNGAGDSVDIYKWTAATNGTALLTQAISNVIADPVSGSNPITSVAVSGAESYVFALPGGTYALDTNGIQITATDTNAASVDIKSVSYGGIAPDEVTSAVVNTRVQYTLEPIELADVSGKSFSLSDLVSSNGGTMVFEDAAPAATGGNGFFTETGATIADPFSWDTASGNLVLTIPWSDPDGSSGTDLLTIRKGLVDMGANSMLIAAVGVDQLNSTEVTDVWGAIVTEQ